MKGKAAHVTRPDLGPMHPLTVEQAQAMAGFAWHDGFVPAFSHCPHPDNDPEGAYRRACQREHVQLLIALFAKQVGQHAVSVGLYSSLDEFFNYGEASDPASAGVDRAGGEL